MVLSFEVIDLLFAGLFIVCFSKWLGRLNGL